MSSYVDFYVVNRERKEVMGLISYGRSSKIYEVADENGVPYEWFRKMDRGFFADVFADLEKEMAYDRNRMVELDERKELVGKADMSVEDKLEAWDQLDCDKRYYVEDLEVLDNAMRFYSVLEGMVDDGDFVYKNEFYVGIEFGREELAKALWGEEKDNV